MYTLSTVYTEHSIHRTLVPEHSPYRNFVLYNILYNYLPLATGRSTPIACSQSLKPKAYTLSLKPKA
jgi:hypothetical protein